MGQTQSPPAMVPSLFPLGQTEGVTRGKQWYKSVDCTKRRGFGRKLYGRGRRWRRPSNQNP